MPRIKSTKSFGKTIEEGKKEWSGNIDGIMLMFDITDRDSFPDFVSWAEVLSP